MSKNKSKLTIILDQQELSDEKVSKLAQLIKFHYPVGEWKDLRSWEDI